MDLRDPVFYVDGVVAEGCTLLASKPKQGKSLLVLQLLLAIAAGEKALGCWDSKQCDCLYLALEDNDRRLKQRATDLTSNLNSPEQLHIPDNIDIHYTWPRMDDGGLERLEQYLVAYPNTKVVVIDVLQKIRPLTGKSRATPYQQDYEALSGLQQLSATHGVAIIVVHHQRKMTGDDSVFDTISGTLGLNGACDNMLVLERKKVGDGYITTLHGDGRELDQPEFALEKSRPLGWRVLGDSDQFRHSRERQDILTVVAAKGKATPADIATSLGKNIKTTRVLCDRLEAAGCLVKEWGDGNRISYRTA